MAVIVRYLTIYRHHIYNVLSAERRAAADAEEAWCVATAFSGDIHGTYFIDLYSTSIGSHPPNLTQPIIHADSNTGSMGPSGIKHLTDELNKLNSSQESDDDDEQDDVDGDEDGDEDDEQDDVDGDEDGDGDY